MPQREPVAIIENGIVVNGELLKHYWQEETERRYRMRRGMFADRESIFPLEGKMGEAPLSPPEPLWTQKQWQYVQQLRAQMLYHQKLLLTHITPKKKKKQGTDLT